MRALLLLASAVCAAAFVGTAPAASYARKSQLQMADRSKSLPFLERPAKLDGSLAGDVGFDPLGLSAIDDVGLDLYWFREAELKHCRVAMLAAAHTIFTDIFGTIPGLPTGKNQVQLFWQVWNEKPNIIVAGFIFLGIIEVVSGIATTAGRANGDRKPGEFGFNPLGFGKDEASKRDLELKEVSNGRLAMWASAGIILQASTTNGGAIDNLLGN